MLSQLPGSIAILNLQPNAAPPTPEDFSDVPPEATIIVKVSTDSTHSFFDLAKVSIKAPFLKLIASHKFNNRASATMQAFRPHKKALVIRQPAHLRSGLLRPTRKGSSLPVLSPDASLERLENVYKQAKKRFDAVFLYEEIVWNRATTAEKLRSLLGFTESEVSSSTARATKWLRCSFSL